MRWTTRAWGLLLLVAAALGAKPRTAAEWWALPAVPLMAVFSRNGPLKRTHGWSRYNEWSPPKAPTPITRKGHAASTTEACGLFDGVSERGRGTGRVCPSPAVPRCGRPHYSSVGGQKAVGWGRRSTTPRRRIDNPPLKKEWTPTSHRQRAKTERSRPSSYTHCRGPGNREDGTRETPPRQGLVRSLVARRHPISLCTLERHWRVLAVTTRPHYYSVNHQRGRVVPH
jgi:hypothetical protein